MTDTATTIMTADEKRQATIDAHRHVASLLEKHPELPIPFVASKGLIWWTLYSWDCPNGVPATVALIRRTIGGKWDKREVDSNYGGNAEMVFSHGNYEIKVQRDAVCTRRVVSTETITKPAVSLPERTETVEIVEWDCTPILSEVSA